ncbi:hypothetical protein CbuD7D7780_04040 [Coxiella burnetii]|uniref:hypothetical protein n=1 Tax=Coxiella burnetii TaxID=777 RepID=UPI0005C54CC6|nr:hypothetical protein [Coxiella burnetii]OYK80540.1 hypothetical protein CbuD7E6568_04020 [Coxiella burnetii]OYK82625.1 hypothetical protein CbuD7D7780_04040 [Coxiella burnetii]
MHSRIKKISHLFRLLFQALFWLTPVAIVLFWSLTPLMYTKALTQFLGLPQPIAFTGEVVVISVILSIIPGAVLMFGLHCLTRLFKNYEQLISL